VPELAFMLHRNSGTRSLQCALRLEWACFCGGGAPAWRFALVRVRANYGACQEIKGAARETGRPKSREETPKEGNGTNEQSPIPSPLM
jgi:hypothetical protein